jgi:hypothetical protein
VGGVGDRDVREHHRHGGLRSGLNVAVAVSVNSACPFCTGKSPAAETLVLCWRARIWPPGLMQSAVALKTM